MLKEIGALWVDHVAVTTDDFETTAKHFLAMPNARILRGPGWNSSQKVNFLFVSFGGDLCIEVLGLPDGGDSPIASHVGNGGGVYHLCYAVADLDAALSQAPSLGARVIVDAKPDDAYDGRRVAFLVHPAHGLFELVEAYGSLVPQSVDVQPRTSTTAPLTPTKAGASDIEDGLVAAFEKIFAASLPQDRASWTQDALKRWDSLAHMRLVMEIERRLDVSIASASLAKMTSFEAFRDHLIADE